MGASSRDALSAVVRRHRGRARLRAAALAVSAAGLVAAGAVAATLPGTATQSTTRAQVASPTNSSGTRTVVHVTSGGSAVTTTTTSGAASGTSTPVAAAGTSHATSGGS
jgi:hypothetical protein